MKHSRRATLQLIGATAIAMPAVHRALADEEAKVHVYNWTDYIGETTLDDFKAATGIEAVYDTYDSSETMEAKMMAGKTGYDVVLQAGSTLQRFLRPRSIRSSINRNCPTGRISTPISSRSSRAG